jgi:hypothetical protein
MRKNLPVSLIGGSASPTRLRSFPLIGLTEYFSWPRLAANNERSGRPE